MRSWLRRVAPRMLLWRAYSVLSQRQAALLVRQEQVRMWTRLSVPLRLRLKIASLAFLLNLLYRLLHNASATRSR